MFGKTKFSNRETFVLIVLSVAAFVPMLWLALQSAARNWRFPLLFPAEFSGRAWEYLLDSSSGILPALFNSLIIALTVTFISIALAIPAARAVALHDFRGKNFLFFLMLMPILSPSVATAIGGHAFFLRYGLTDSWFGVMLIHLIPTLPYCLLTLASSFARFEVDLETQARTLGASTWQVWRYITLPSLAPAIAVSAVFAFLISWSQYLTTLLIGGGKIMTLPLVLISFQRGTDEAVTAALTLVFLVPAVLFLLISARFWKATK
jgi:putative spermidine/putrescine transport system permease protein